MHDVVITNGTVVDGTGARPVDADVAIDGGRISALTSPGKGGPAHQVIDAAGCVVTPGFVDPHTHLDAQLWWEPSGIPSLLHGVTTAVIGSCGFGVAPCPPGGADYLLHCLEAVEEIPFSSTSVGVPMEWGTWPEFFEHLGGLDLGVNVAGFVPHSALRYSVMGDRARGDAGPDDIRAQVGALEAALSAGAVGFASSRGGNHHDAEGRPMPSRCAGDDELGALVAACRGRTWQINLASKGARGRLGAEAVIEEVDRYLAWSEQAGARLTWTPFVVLPGDDVGWRSILDHHRLLAMPDRIAPQVSPQPIVASIGFEGPSFAALIDGWEAAWHRFVSMDPDARPAVLRDPDFRSALRSAPEDPLRMTSPYFERWRLAASRSRPDLIGRSLRQIGSAVGSHPVDAMLDLALDDDMETVVEIPLVNLDAEATADLATDPTTLIGLGDAGAHVRSITNYAYPTYVLTELVVRRRRLSIEDAVHRLSAQPARFLGIPERGIVRAGAHADVCVVDLQRLALRPTELVSDLPGGAKRLMRTAAGFVAVLVNGKVTVADDVAGPNRAGELVRVS